MEQEVVSLSLLFSPQKHTLFSKSFFNHTRNFLRFCSAQRKKNNEKGWSFTFVHFKGAQDLSSLFTTFWILNTKAEVLPLPPCPLI